MKYIIAVLFLACYVYNIQAQAKYDYNIMFGYQTNEEVEDRYLGQQFGFTDAGLDVDTVALGLRLDGYATTMSDREGNLLFYSNGCDIIGADGELLLGGDGINLPSAFYSSQCEGSFQRFGGAAINSLPDPGNELGYYLLYMGLDIIYSDTDSADIAIALAMYSYIEYVDGELVVTKKNEFIMERDTFGRTLFQAMRHANGRDWFFNLRKQNNNTQYIFTIDDTGIHRVGEQSIGPEVTPLSYRRGGCL